jgi:hypothetical protein
MTFGCALASAGCGSDPGTQPGSLRFGQVGEIRVTVVTPLIVVSDTQVSVEGDLQQVLTWRSDGRWQSVESVSYDGRVGGERATQSQGDPSTYGAAYATLITQLNDDPALRLFTDELDPDLEVDCLSETVQSRSSVTFQIYDEPLDSRARWTRCGTGTLEELNPGGAGPDAAASRVIQAAILARNYSLSEDWESIYLGTLPFGTLDQGDDSRASLNGPLIFRQGLGANASPDVAEEFAAFWVRHSSSPRPAVDWSTEMVLVGAVGVVPEAGESVEIRRVVSDVLGTTLVEYYRRSPGDFCSPADRSHVPYHIVVVPRVDGVVRFGTVRQEFVPCGL